MQVVSSKRVNISLVEMGAGKGTLFFDILSSIRKLSDKNIPQAVDFLKKSTFHIIEIGEVLTTVQKEKLKEFSINWSKNFTEFLSKSDSESEIIFISNELFDCFPIDQFIKTDIGWRERLIDSTGDSPKFVLDKFDPQTHQFVEELIAFNELQKFLNNVPIGAVFEYSFEAKDCMTRLCESIQERGGMAIIIDYGYIKNEFVNSLQAVKNHQKVSVLETPGEVDITALVNFSFLQKISQIFDLKSSLITQRQFLLGLGIEQRRERLLQKKSSNEAAEINAAINRLIAPDQMGELFKTLIVWR